MNVAVTGASGHIGNCLCRELVKKGLHLKVLYHKNEDKLSEFGAEIIEGSILDPKVLARLFEGVDIVFHLAARISIDNRNVKEVYNINVSGTENVIEACNLTGVSKLIHFSTIHTLSQSSDTTQVLNESNPLITASKIAYEYTKAEAERLVLNAAENGLDAVILNPTAVVGPFDYQPSFLGQALIKIYQNKLPMLVPGGYDFVDVRDVVLAAINAGTKGKKGERYILSGNWLSLIDVSKKIEEITAHKTPKFVAPTLLAKIGLTFIQGWAMLSGQQPLYTAESLHILYHSSKNISNQKARTELGFDPRPIEKTIEDTFHWYEKNNLV